ncbi:hypothetical protein EN925_14395 [Mesorhizobium sp. M7A.F.Ca.US.006.04.2.1]|nr:hypothetical protein EN990_29545 [Mesorhizobium sp. M7A.F.Ca.US.005.03.1.1]RUY11973.1 hypothetical protein EN991_24315 [Mesorhizobium sp. M7A.F.Ca.US.005.03.2.1]RUY28498.1 hypothetical protein EN979_13250 [Mesorhizobium sp. M7A.F.Ca.US.001.04.2.1]RUY42797.1 hypothetical protein EN978_11250 [Mesorhizobium sp. M7A.F.Ca.US.001.04.1.1]RVA03914.1 hypothetical protein EN938_14520 [Mesorhizobium sp. M7A.F.Ca.US.001.02.1.1]RVA11918.1 hypothetical protein EN932_14200 [Mesorhizobium sp. M7A.F.Ca.US.0
MGKAGGTAPPSVLPDISPSRGRSTVPPAFASSQMLKEKVSPVTQPISLEEEMSGRTEGGVQALTGDINCMEGATLAASR